MDLCKEIIKKSFISADISDYLYIIICFTLSPELNPSEQIWRMLRGDYFGNRTFKTLEEAMNRARAGMKNMAHNKDSIIQLTLWPWISDALTTIIKYRKK